jgi:hypothetical protein
MTSWHWESVYFCENTKSSFIALLTFVLSLLISLLLNTIVKSSANNIIIPLITKLKISLMKMRNRWRPTTLFCITEILDKDLVAFLFRPDLIYCLRSVKYDLKSFIILLKPILRNLKSKILWCTKSKAFLRSRIRTQT